MRLIYLLLALTLVPTMGLAQVEFETADEQFAVLVEEALLAVAPDPDEMCDLYVDYVTRFCGPEHYNERLCNTYNTLLVKWCREAERQSAV